MTKARMMRYSSSEPLESLRMAGRIASRLPTVLLLVVGEHSYVLSVKRRLIKLSIILTQGWQKARTSSPVRAQSSLRWSFLIAVLECTIWSLAEETSHPTDCRCCWKSGLLLLLLLLLSLCCSWCCWLAAWCCLKAISNCSKGLAPWNKQHS